MNTSNTIFSNLEVDITTLPHTSQLSFQPLEKKYIRIMLLNRILLFLILITFLWGAYFIFRTDLNMGLKWPFIISALLFIPFLIHFIIIKKAFQIKGYAIREKDISYKSGFFWTKCSTISYNRVQQITVSQPLMLRFFGLYGIHIEDASQSSMGLYISGLKKETAESIKEYILECINNEKA